MQKTFHSPNLTTIRMVEKTLQNSEKSILSVAELKRQLPKQVNHQTLKIILEYLEESNKIVFSSKGITWIYTSPENLRRLLSKSISWEDLRKN